MSPEYASRHGEYAIGDSHGEWLAVTATAIKKRSRCFHGQRPAFWESVAIRFPNQQEDLSSAYVLFTGGMALHFLAMCYWAIDIQGYKKWAAPFLVYGTNAITAYFASGIFVRILLMIQVGGGAESEPIALRSWLYNNLFASWLSPQNASLGFALCYVALWCMLLVPLYRRKIFIKI
jgi:predicted acyltransferase